MESTEDWIRRIGSKEAMQRRHEQRMGMQLNAPMKGPRGLGKVVQDMAGRKPHSLFCTCAECIPDELREEMRGWRVVTKGMFERVSGPVTVIASKSDAPKRRKSKWEQRGSSGN